MSNEQPKTAVKCGECGGPVNAPEEPKPTDEVSCQNCPNKATYQEMMDEAQAYLHDYAETRIDATFKEAAKNSDFIKYKSGPKSTRKYRFILDL